MHTRLQDAKKLIQDLEADKSLAIAEAKQQMYLTMEGKDTELTELRERLTAVRGENEELAGKVEKMEKAGKAKTHGQFLYNINLT